MKGFRVALKYTSLAATVILIVLSACLHNWLGFFGWIAVLAYEIRDAKYAKN